nr:hypothetical protein [uncultured Solibaculum sp.]
MSGQTLWQQIYKLLQDAGVAVYTPSQHEDYCSSPYCVVSQDRITPQEEMTAGYKTLTVTAFVPVDQYSALDSYIQSIYRALEPLRDTVEFTGQVVYEVDRDFRAHKATLTYRAMQPIEFSSSQQPGIWITGIEKVEFSVDGQIYPLQTACQCRVEPVFSPGQQQTLQGDGKTLAWMPPQDVVVGYRISLQDVAMTPHVFALVDGGQITEQDGIWSSYQAPALLTEWPGKEMTLRILVRQTASSDQTKSRIRLTFERCQGQAVPFVWKDGVFCSPTYTLLSRGTTGGNAYLMEQVDESQTIGEG